MTCNAIAQSILESDLLVTSREEFDKYLKVEKKNAGLRERFRKVRTFEISFVNLML